MTNVDIISGFLGAGKTTLIKKLIADAYPNEKLVLIENEFGETNIDGGFLKDSGIEISELSSGCICCSLAGDFTKALHDVAARFHPDRILIEPSGVGKLSDVIAAVQDAAVQTPELRLNSFAAVVDAGKIRVYRKNFGEFYNDQIETAGTLILSRTQKLSQQALEAAAALLREANPNTAVITTPWDELDGKTIRSAMEKKSLEQELLAEAMPHAEPPHHAGDAACCHGHSHAHHHDHEEACRHPHSREESRCHEHHSEPFHSPSLAHGENGAGHGRAHTGESNQKPPQPSPHFHKDGCACGCHNHAHPHHHAEDIFSTWGRETPKAFSPEAIRSALAQLDSGRYGAVLRAKGIVPGEDGAWIHFDYVPGEPELRTGPADYTGRLCVIGVNLREALLDELFGLS